MATPTPIKQIKIGANTHNIEIPISQVIDLTTTLAEKASTATVTTTTAGLMSSADKAKLDKIADEANNYTLPLAGSDTRGGIKTGYSGGGANIPLKLSSEKGYVTLTSTAVTSALGYTPPTVNTTYGNASQSAAGLMSANDKKKLDGIANNANNYTYTLPQATSATLGGVKIGNNITVTSGVISLTQSNVTAALGYTPPTVNTTYNNASQSAAGLMSSTDKTKLDGIAANANNYSLPNASSTTLGGVKIGSNITLSNGVISLTQSNVTSALGYTPPTVDTGFTSTSITGDGNAITGVSYDSSTRKITFTKGATYNNFTYSLPLASSTTRGGIKIGYSDANANIGLKLSNEKGYVTLTTTAITSALGYTPPTPGHGHDYIPITAKGAANGVATLDSNGLVPSTQLPSYVDDVIEGYYISEKVFKKQKTDTAGITLETGKIYVDIDTKKTYRYGGTTLVEISKSLGLGETADAAFAGDKGKVAYDHAVTTATNPHNTTASDLGLANFKDKTFANVLDALTSTQVTTALSYVPATKDTATTQVAGLMSATDKAKLDGIANNANNYTYTLPQATSSVLGGVKIGNNISVTNGVVSLTQSNVTAALGYTPPQTDTTYSNASQSAAGLMSANDKKKLDGIATNANNYSLPAASTTALGGIMVGKVNSTTVTVSNANRYYAVELNKDNKAIVNVPWQAPDGNDNQTVKVGSTTFGANDSITIEGGGDTTVSATNTATTKKITISTTLPTDYVSYSSQTLTTAQKTQARSNIGAGTSNFNGVYGSLTDIPDDFPPSSHAHGNIANGGTLGTANRVLITDGNKKITISSISTTELGYLSGVTSNIQTQLGGKAGTATATTQANGLMSSNDKAKLENIEAGANNYSLPAATSTALGGVKVATSITSTGTDPVQGKAIYSALAGKAGTATATTAANGLMSSSDKTKLDSITVNATTTTVAMYVVGIGTGASDSKSAKKYNTNVKVLASGNLQAPGFDVAGSATMQYDSSRKAIKFVFT